MNATDTKLKKNGNGIVLLREQQKKKQVGYIFLMWGLIAPVLIDNYLVKPNIGALDFGSFVPSITTLLVTPCVAFFVTKVYWK